MNRLPPHLSSIHRSVAFQAAAPIHGGILPAPAPGAIA